MKELDLRVSGTPMHLRGNLSPRRRQLEAELDEARREVSRCERRLEEAEDDVTELIKLIETSHNLMMDENDLITSLLSLKLAGNEREFLERVQHDGLNKEDTARLREIEGVHRFELIDLQKQAA